MSRTMDEYIARLDEIAKAFNNETAAEIVKTWRRDGQVSGQQYNAGRQLIFAQDEEKRLAHERLLAKSKARAKAKADAEKLERLTRANARIRAARDRNNAR